MLRFNNKNIRLMSLMSFWCLFKQPVGPQNFGFQANFDGVSLIYFFWNP